MLSELDHNGPPWNAQDVNANIDDSARKFQSIVVGTAAADFTQDHDNRFEFILAQVENVI
jgi:hypothetical protein